MSGEKDLTKLIASMTPVLAGESYIFGTLDSCDYQQLSLIKPLCTFQEKEGLTVIVSQNKAEEHNIEYTGIFKCITLNVHSSLEAVGLTAAVASKLAQSNISANVVAAYYHDHIFVGESDAENALHALIELTQAGI